MGWVGGLLCEVDAHEKYEHGDFEEDGLKRDVGSFEGKVVFQREFYYAFSCFFVETVFVFACWFFLFLKKNLFSFLCTCVCVYVACTFVRVSVCVCVCACVCASTHMLILSAQACFVLEMISVYAGTLIW